VTVTSLAPVTATAIAAGLYHSLAVAADGTVYSWGYNSNGQLGSGNTQNSVSALQVAGLTGVRAVAAGDYSSLALLRDGTARAWGYNGYGQLGNSSTSDASTPVAVTGSPAPWPSRREAITPSRSAARSRRPRPTGRRRA